MKNIPEVKVGIIAVSRDCFPIDLSRKRRDAVLDECKKQKISITEISVIIENEKHVLDALKELQTKQINALVIFLGNFGPEGPLTILAQKFDGPVMVCAAAEETQENLINGRGDAYCGLLSACYNLKLRNTKAFIPEYPIGTAPQIVDMIKDFLPVARVLIGLKSLKIFAFGPRPQDFYTCHAPLKPLYDLGVEVMENSELDLLDLYEKNKNDPQIPEIVKEMEKELGAGNADPTLLKQLAQYEVTLLNFYNSNLGTSKYGVFAVKCWPAFENFFKSVPCYVNGRLARKGIPVACEVDIYGALSEFIGQIASESTATILDINNSVPKDMFDGSKNLVKGYKLTDLFMAFHCGNTASDCMKNCALKFQLIMHRLIEPDKKPEITRGTLEGQLKPGDMTIFRLQSTIAGELKAYIAEGESLDIDPKSFGAIGVFGIHEMGRFYRYALLEKQFPHHTAAVFKHIGKVLFNVFKMLGIDEIYVNLPAGTMYKDENPYK